MKRTALQHNAPANDAVSYAGYRFPPDVISYAVWLYYRFPLSLRMVEELLAARGIDLTYETVRRWSVKFGLGIARRIRSTALAGGDKWVMRRFKSARHLQRFTSVHDQVANLFMHCRYNANAQDKRQARTQAFEAWETVTGNSMLGRLAA